MQPDKLIIDALNTIDQATFEKLARRLLYYGAFEHLGIEQRELLYAFGINIEKNKTRGSKGRVDVENSSGSLKVEISTREDWDKKLIQDIKDIKKNGIIVDKFIFCTNREIGSLNIKPKCGKIDARQYCKNELKCKIAEIIGQQELLLPLTDPRFFYIRRDYLEIEDDFFVSAGQFYNIIKSNYPVKSFLINQGEIFQVFDDKIKFLPNNQILLLHLNNYEELLNLLAEWAIIKFKFDENYFNDNGEVRKIDAGAFIRWPLNTVKDSYLDEVKTEKARLFIFIWGAHLINNISEYLQLKGTDGQLVFICQSGQEDKVGAEIKKITSCNIQIVKIPTKLAIITEENRKKHDKKIKQIQETERQLILKYEALVYYYFPYRKTSSEITDKIKILLSINADRLEILTQTTINSNILQLTGDILSLQDNAMGRKLLEDFINDGTFSIEQL